MDAKKAEQLTMLIEECAEVIHACTKTLRHGPSSKHPLHLNGDTNWEQLQREFTQLVAVGEQVGLYVPDPIVSNQVWQKKLRYTHYQENTND